MVSLLLTNQGHRYGCASCALLNSKQHYSSGLGCGWLLQELCDRDLDLHSSSRQVQVKYILLREAFTQHLRWQESLLRYLQGTLSTIHSCLIGSFMWMTSFFHQTIDFNLFFFFWEIWAPLEIQRYKNFSQGENCTNTYNLVSNFRKFMAQ